MRRFSLITGIGESVDLTTETVFFHDPDGLGFEISATYRQIGKRFSPVSTDTSQGSITGSIAFLGSKPYEQYYNFMKTVLGGGLILVYSTDDNVTKYYREVELSSVGKSEILQDGGYLDVSVTFTAKTPWYRKYTLTTNNKVSGDSGFIFPVKWPVKFRSTMGMSVILDVESHCNSPCRLIIDGPLTNPSWRHYVNGRLSQTGAVTVDIPEDHHLVIDNRGDSYEMAIYNSDLSSVTKDVYQLSDFSTGRFIELKYGRNQISVSSANTTDMVDIKLEANVYYDTV